MPKLNPFSWYLSEPAMHLRGRHLLTRLLADYRVLVVEKRSCSYCRLLRNVLQNYIFTNGSIYRLDIEGRADCAEIQDCMEELSKRRTVPQLFVGGSFVGGATEVEQLHKTGKLSDLFKKVSAI